MSIRVRATRFDGERMARADAVRKIGEALRSVEYCDYHFHWDKDQWYPHGSFCNIGKAVRSPLELLFQGYAGSAFVQVPGFPFSTAWELIGQCLADEKKAYEIVQPFMSDIYGDPSLPPMVKGFQILYDMPDLNLSRPIHYWELSRRVRKAYQQGFLDRLSEAYGKASLRKSINIWTSRYAREHFDQLSEAQKEQELELTCPTFWFDYSLVLPFRYRQDIAIAKWFWELVQDINGLPATLVDQPWRNNPYAQDIARHLRSITFDDYLNFVDDAFVYFSKRGVQHLKSAGGHIRTLEFLERSEKDARRAFVQLQSDFLDRPAHGNDFDEELRVFEDYVFYRCLRRAKEYGWTTIQIHTGYGTQSAEYGRPSLLEEAVRKNPQMNFIMLHGGKHFHSDVVSLCDTYGNVVADFTGIPVLDPELARKMVRRFITRHPYRTAAALNMTNVEGSAGMAQINRRLIAETLGDLYHRGTVGSIDEAVRVGRSIIFDLPRKLFAGRF